MRRQSLQSDYNKEDTIILIVIVSRSRPLLYWYCLSFSIVCLSYYRMKYEFLSKVELYNDIMSFIVSW